MALDVHLVDLSGDIAILCIRLYPLRLFCCKGQGISAMIFAPIMRNIDLVIPQSKSPYICCIYRMLIGGAKREKLHVTGSNDIKCALGEICDPGFIFCWTLNY